VAGVLYELLPLVGGYYVGHTVRNAGNVYGTFAIVIGLLSWIYLSTTVALLSAEIDVVAVRRLWPRSLGATSVTADDRRPARARSARPDRRGHRRDPTRTAIDPKRRRRIARLRADHAGTQRTSAQRVTWRLRRFRCPR
jgi:hypothetical protein